MIGNTVNTNSLCMYFFSLIDFKETSIYEVFGELKPPTYQMSASPTAQYQMPTHLL